jgi:hypothetical protein
LAAEYPNWNWNIRMITSTTRCNPWFFLRSKKSRSKQCQ